MELSLSVCSNFFYTVYKSVTDEICNLIISFFINSCLNCLSKHIIKTDHILIIFLLMVHALLSHDNGVASGS